VSSTRCARFDYDTSRHTKDGALTRSQAIGTVRAEMGRAMVVVEAAFAAIVLGATACSGGGTSGSAADTGPHTSPGVCMPDPTQTGNSKNVGAYCTPGGDECAKYPEAKFCAIDLDPEGAKFCIKIGCKANSDCAEGSCCTGRVDNPIHACVPGNCLVDDAGNCPPIPGISDDAGAGADASGADR
jgi:hypothetical protein